MIKADLAQPVDLFNLDKPTKHHLSYTLFSDDYKKTYTYEHFELKQVKMFLHAKACIEFLTIIKTAIDKANKELRYQYQQKQQSSIRNATKNLAMVVEHLDTPDIKLIECAQIYFDHCHAYLTKLEQSIERPQVQAWYTAAIAETTSYMERVIEKARQRHGLQNIKPTAKSKNGLTAA